MGVFQAVFDGVLGVLFYVGAVHGLKEEVVEVEVLVLFGFGVGLGIDEF